MMSSSSKTTLTKDQLFASLESDEIHIATSILTKARNGDGDALFIIANEYYGRGNYAKAIAWSQLSNYPCAQTMLGYMYHRGQGVAINYNMAIEYYLKAAGQKDMDAWLQIGYLFESGDGVPVDKYKALEWYSKDDLNKIHIQKLITEGYHISDKDKHKSIERLIEETESIIKEEKKIRDIKVKQEENQHIDDVDPVKQLKQEAQALNDANVILEQQLKDRDHIIGLLKQENRSLEDQCKKSDSSNKTIELLESLVQSKTNEIEFLKEKSTHLEKENRELKELLEGRHLSRHGYGVDSKKRKVGY